jgi:hypothetical protein
MVKKTIRKKKFKWGLIYIHRCVLRDHSDVLRDLLRCVTRFTQMCYAIYHSDVLRDLSKLIITNSDRSVSLDRS